MKILAVDFGLKNLGFAIAETPFATPYSTIKVVDLSHAISKSMEVVNNLHPDLIVVGIPDGEIAASVTKYVNLLRGLLDIDVVTHPETLSSHEAVAKLREVGTSKKKLAADHAYAAAIILEDYLDLNPNLVKI